MRKRAEAANCLQNATLEIEMSYRQVMPIIMVMMIMIMMMVVMIMMMMIMMVKIIIMICNWYKLYEGCLYISKCYLFLNFKSPKVLKLR